MSQLLVSNLDEDIETELKRGLRATVGANLSGPRRRTLEDEDRQIPVDALEQHGDGEERDSVGLGTRIAALFAGVGLDADIPEWKGEKIEPIDWE